MNLNHQTSPLGNFKLEKMPDEPIFPEKKNQLDQDRQLKRNHSQFDDSIADDRHADPETLIPEPVPPIDNPDEDYDVKEFISLDISGALKKTALRKLFHSPEFNQRDGLDDYDEDFQIFECLGDIVTSDMRYHLERLTDTKNGSCLTGDPAVIPQPDAVEQIVETSGSKIDAVSYPEMAKSMPGATQVGTFFQPALCVHGASGLTGCTRCLDACPAGAISTAGTTIRIDPERCRQKGLCTTVCPTDALIRFIHKDTDLLTSVRLSLAESSVINPAVVFYEETLDPALFQTVPEGTLGFCVESIEAVGMEIWLAALAYGTSRVVMLAGKGVAPAVFDTLEIQVSCATQILEGMGLEKERIQIVRAETLLQEALLNESILAMPIGSIRPARFEPGDTKRTLIFQSIDYLYEQARGSQPATALARGAPFGEICIDPGSCTLCMACVAVCPAKALSDGGEMPQIRFLEGRCVQCGLCRSACPENAIRVSSRMVFEPEVRSSLRILHGAEPFCCTVCGRPFATRAMVDKMVEKLSGHWMYENDAEKKRLLMCGECRSRNFFETRAGR